MMVTVAVVALSYMAVTLACARTDGLHLRSSDGEEPSLVTFATDSPGPDSDDELCKFMHEHIASSQVSRAGTNLGAKIYDLSVCIDVLPAHRDVFFNSFRPPGYRFALAQVFSLQLYSILRI